jgi:hypothetical protein
VETHRDHELDVVVVAEADEIGPRRDADVVQLVADGEPEPTEHARTGSVGGAEIGYVELLDLAGALDVSGRAARRFSGRLRPC